MQEAISLRLVLDEQNKPPTRPLEPRERALLDHLLAPDFKGADALRAQAAQAAVIVQDEFPWFVKLYVPRTAPPATDLYRNPVTRAVTADPTRFGADINLWLDGDYLGHIAVMWMEEPWPELPSPDQLDAATLNG
jgi:hypothetical protein